MSGRRDCAERRGAEWVVISGELGRLITNPKYQNDEK